MCLGKVTGNLNKKREFIQENFFGCQLETHGAWNSEAKDESNGGTTGGGGNSKKYSSKIINDSVGVVNSLDDPDAIYQPVSLPASFEMEGKKLKYSKI